MTLTLRTMKKHMGWDDAKDDFVILDDAGNSVGRIHKDPTSPRWIWSVNTSPYPAPPPNNGVAPTLEEAKQQFKQRYVVMKGTGREAIRMIAKIWTIYKFASKLTWIGVYRGQDRGRSG